MNQKKAEEMIQEVSNWLASGAPGAKLNNVYDTIQADLARDYSHQLLGYSEAEGSCGCLLCGN